MAGTGQYSIGVDTRAISSGSLASRRQPEHDLEKILRRLSDDVVWGRQRLDDPRGIFLQGLVSCRERRSGPSRRIEEDFLADFPPTPRQPNGLAERCQRMRCTPRVHMFGGRYAEAVHSSGPASGNQHDVDVTSPKEKPYKLREGRGLYV